MNIKKEVKNQFGQNAENYVSSKLHAKGKDLEMMVKVSEVKPNTHLLDIGTGGGHVANAFAPIVEEVVAFDLTPEILESAKKFIQKNGFTNVSFVQGDAESLPFENDSFDYITCRIAAHHFPNVKKFIQESARVIQKEGYLLLIDNVAPEKNLLDEFYNNIEKIRDLSHYRAWKKTEWIKLIEEEDFIIELIIRFEKTFDFNDWCERMKVSNNIKKELEQIMLNSSEEIKRKFQIVYENKHIISFKGESIILKARKA